MSATVPKLFRVGKMELAVESSFAQTAGAYANVKVIAPVDLSGLERPALSDEHVRVGITQVARIPGPRTGSITTRHYLHGFSPTLPVGAPTTTSHPLFNVLAFALGTGQAGGYVSQDPTGSTTADLRGADLTGFVIGQAVAYSTPVRGGYHVAWGTNNVPGVTDIYTFLQTAPEAASTVPTVIYGSAVAAHTSGLDWFSAGVREALRLRFTSHDGEEQYTCAGCIPTGLKFAFPRGELPTMEVTWGVASWSYAWSVAAPTPGTYAYAEPEFVGGAWVSWGTGGAVSTRVGGLDVDCGLTVVPIPNPNLPNGIGGWAVTDRRPKVTFSVYRSGANNGELDDYDEQNGRPFTATIGSQPGRLISFCLPNARVIEYPKRTDEEGLLVSPIVLEAHNYTGDTADAGSVVEDTDFRIAFL